jgi:hypothetical protein
MHAELWRHKQADQTHHLSSTMQYAIWQGKQHCAACCCNVMHAMPVAQAGRGFVQCRQHQSPSRRVTVIGHLVASDQQAGNSLTNHAIPLRSTRYGAPAAMSLISSTGQTEQLASSQAGAQK